jgi:ankyrin repeat protein
MLNKRSYRYHQLLVKIFIYLLTLHLVQCQGCGDPAGKSKPELQKPNDPLPVNKLDEKIVEGITNDFLKTIIKDLQEGKPIDIAKQDPTPESGNGTPIMAAVKEPKNQVEILQYLLSHHQGSPEELKKKINRSNADSETALLLATRVGNPANKNYYNPEVIKLLVKNGADPYQVNGKGLTPVWGAIIDNNLEALESLLNNKVGYSGICAPKFGATPLHIAANKGNKAIITYLVTHGADKDKLDKNRFRPIDYAKDKDDEIKNLLRP